MIELACSKCGVVLTMDDAFAGGVCRCQHCGTIQTVPRELKGATRSRTPMAGRALMSKPAARLPDEMPSLEDLEQVVASSGLGGTSLSGSGVTGSGIAGSAFAGSGFSGSTAGGAGLVETGQARTVATGGAINPAPPPMPLVRASEPLMTARQAILLGAWGLGMFLLGVLVTWLIMRNSGGDLPSREQSRTDSVVVNQPERQNPPKPHFMGVPLKGPTVVYVLDRGEGTARTFDRLKAAAADSADTLGERMTFQVVFWETDRLVLWPPEGATPAATKNINICRNVLADVHAGGQSQVEPALLRALAARPAEIVLATGQSGLGSDFVQAVLNTRKDSPVRIHTVAVGDEASVAALKAIAEQTGGQFRAVRSADLQELVD